MFLLGVVGFIFFGAIGYFAYTFGQCLCVFSRLDKIMNKKIIGVLSVFLYIYFVYVNQDVLIQALMKPFTDI
tara:strand:+ start:495 stop:710 length:216 start_codon:yes stop_codon:yes gene_type:complete